MIPGQMRPHFARNDRLIRRTLVAVVLLAGIIEFAAFKDTGSSLPWFFAFLVALVVAYQVSVAIRMRNLRGFAARLAERFPSDRVLIGNVRFVGADDRGPEAVGYQTVVAQFSKGVLAFWNPDRAAEAFFAMPLPDLDVDVTATNPPRWGIVAPLTEGAVYLSVWQSSGLSPETPDGLRALANELFPGAHFPVPPTPPAPRIGF